ncbi:hypothetical protein Landi51_00396 [Colletotrichum acutatum]
MVITRPTFTLSYGLPTQYTYQWTIILDQITTIIDKTRFRRNSSNLRPFGYILFSHTLSTTPKSLCPQSSTAQQPATPTVYHIQNYPRLHLRSLPSTQINNFTSAHMACSANDFITMPAQRPSQLPPCPGPPPQRPLPPLPTRG